MRNGLAVACLLVSACATENEIRFTATLQAETNGVVLSENGLDMFAAMSGTTCTIDTNWGCPTADEDLPTSDERVVDHWGGVTLGASSEGVHIIDHGVWDQDADEPILEVRTASLTEAGHVVVSGHDGACSLQRIGDTTDTIEVDGVLCQDGATYSVDRITGTVYAATAAGVLAVGEDRSVQTFDEGDLADFDQSLQLLYTADRGSDILRALDLEQMRVWEVEVGGPIRSVAARGNRGEALVLVDRPNGLAGIERYEGESGRLLGKSTIPTSDGVIESSDNGRTIAVVRMDEVNFFALDGDTKPVVDDTPPTCIVPTADNPDINLGD